MTEPGRVVDAELTPDQFGRRSTATIVLVVVMLVLIVAGICVLTYVGNIEPEEPSGGVDHQGTATAPPKSPDSMPGAPPGPAP